MRGVKPTWDYTVLHSISTSLGAAKVLGLSPGQMHHALALAAVANITLLQTRSDFSLAEVAAHAGFSDQSQFSHHFKRLLGVTPGQFRTRVRTDKTA